MPAEVQRKQYGVENLKIAVGNDTYVEERLRHRITKMKDVIAKVWRIEESHVEFTLLRACLGSVKLAYVLRGVPPSDLVTQTMDQADDVIRAAFEKVVGDNVGAPAWTQAGLQPSIGGMGRRHCEDMAVPASIGSAAETSHLVLRLLGRASVSMSGLQ